jgi:PEP-CTERM motif-containing protein
MYFASNQNQSRATAPSITSNNIGEPWLSEGNQRNRRIDSAFLTQAIYPYSVVPGGIHSSEGLREAASRDPVVGLHYSDFNLASIRLTRLKTAQSAYVSYRLGNKIYWTSRKLKLAKDEEVITDGVYFARTRCGNQISSTPKAPTWVLEPRPEIFESPVETQVAELPTPPMFPAELPMLVRTEPVPPVFIPGHTPSAPSGFVPPPPIFILPPHGSNPPPPPHSPAIPVPEPSTWTLLSTGLITMYAALRKKIGKSPPH